MIHVSGEDIRDLAKWMEEDAADDNADRQCGHPERGYIALFGKRILLTRVDGSLKVEKFVNEQSANDGYEAWKSLLPPDSYSHDNF